MILIIVVENKQSGFADHIMLVFISLKLNLYPLLLLLLFTVVGCGTLLFFLAFEVMACREGKEGRVTANQYCVVFIL